MEIVAAFLCESFEVLPDDTIRVTGLGTNVLTTTTGHGYWPPFPLVIRVRLGQTDIHGAAIDVYCSDTHGDRLFGQVTVLRGGQASTFVLLDVPAGRFPVTVPGRYTLELCTGPSIRETVVFHLVDVADAGQRDT